MVNRAARWLYKKGRKEGGKKESENGKEGKGRENKEKGREKGRERALRLHAVAVLGGGHAGLGLEEAAEGCLVGEVEQKGDFLYVELNAMAEQHAGLYGDIAVDPLQGVGACMLLDDGCEVLGGEMEEIGVESHFAAFAVVFGDGLVESAEESFA